MKISYIEKRFSSSSTEIIDSANKIINEYADKGFDLTLRQLYYQFVARDLLPNEQKQYKRLGSIINDARLAGLVDWRAIVDRTRRVQKNSHWSDPGEIIEACAESFMIDRWKNQGYRPEVWIEKDALIGVISGVCKLFDVPYFSCRGYTSQSSMWKAGRKMLVSIRMDQIPVILHLTDHDPSGLDMSSDIENRLTMFTGTDFIYKRLALNMDQVEEFGPPPNPAKVTDSRYAGYVVEYGEESWELDALDPEYMEELIRENILQYRNEKVFREDIDREREYIETLKELAENWG